MTIFTRQSAYSLLTLDIYVTAYVRGSINVAQPLSTPTFFVLPEMSVSNCKQTTISIPVIGAFWTFATLRQSCLAEDCCGTIS